MQMWPAWAGKMPRGPAIASRMAEYPAVRSIRLEDCCALRWAPGEADLARARRRENLGGAGLRAPPCHRVPLPTEGDFGRRDAGDARRGAGGHGGAAGSILEGAIRAGLERGFCAFGSHWKHWKQVGSAFDKAASCVLHKDWVWPCAFGK